MFESFLRRVAVWLKSPTIISSVGTKAPYGLTASDKAAGSFRFNCWSSNLACSLPVPPASKTLTQPVTQPYPLETNELSLQKHDDLHAAFKSLSLFLYI